MKSIGSNYPGGHKGSIYSGNKNTNITNTTCLSHLVNLSIVQ